MPPEARNALDEAWELIGSTPLPTGSRVYGAAYAREDSDWDFYFDAPDWRDAFEALQCRGWDGGGSGKAGCSFYKENVNVIVLDGIDFAAFHLATLACIDLQPQTRDEAVKVFKRIAASFKETDAIFAR